MPAPRPSANLAAAAQRRSFLNSFDLRSVATTIFQAKPLRDEISRRFPAFSGGIGKEVFAEKFLQAIDDPAFQILAVTGIQQLMGLGLLPQEAYKPEAFQQLFRTKGYGGQSIAAGAYQKTTGKLPPREILPPITIAQFEAQLQQIGNNPNLQPAQKLKAASDFIATTENKISQFNQFLKTNLPFVSSLGL